MAVHLHPAILSLREPTQYESALKAAQANQDSKKQGKRKKG